MGEGHERRWRHKEEGGREVRRAGGWVKGVSVGGGISERERTMGRFDL